MKRSIKKVIRFISIYGVRRTMIKITGRQRSNFFKIFFPELFIKRKKSISLIGCGQFGFSTISFFLLKERYNSFLDCFDTDWEKALTAKQFYGYHATATVQELINNKECEIVYIASNHYSHTPYAIECLKRNKKVYIEKPVAVNWEQFKNLLSAIKNSETALYVGYNRPFSKAISILSKFIDGFGEPITFNCFISGHLIDQNHWYRKPEEGTRVCGNIGHWIDLAVHLMNKRGEIPGILHITIAYGSQKEMDDNLSIAISSEIGDLVTIVLTARTEPFEGINETINFQCRNVIAKIDDFRKMKIWKDEHLSSYSFKPKDVGHKIAIMQPYIKKYERDFLEIEISTVIMLSITDMVLKRETYKIIYPFNVLEELKKTN